MRSLTPEDIDAILPQTQCGLCGHGGCMPYAEALIYDRAAINLCPPGGVDTLKKIGTLIQQDPEPFIAEMYEKSKPPMKAIIREAECIGCTKCIQACPVDAILGSAKQMHTVIADECTGCELCVAPCPVDCIDLVKVENDDANPEKYRARFNARNQRIKSQEIDKKTKKQNDSLLQKKNYIEEALKLAKAKKSGV